MNYANKMKNIFEKYYDWDKRRIALLGNFISSMIRSRSVNLQKVAENLEGSAKTESNYRRIQKMFQKQDIDYEITAKILSGVLPDNEKWIIAIDRTNWKLGKLNVNLLVLSAVYKGMAIPLLWKFLTKETVQDDKIIEIGKRGNSNTEERKDILEKFINIFGIKKIAFLVADREFIGEKWFNWLDGKKINFLIRIRNNTKIYDGKKKVDVSNILFGVENDDFSIFDKTKIFGLDLYLGGIKSSKSKDKLILVSNAKMSKKSLEIYRKRWEIETMFGAFKSKGFNMEESKLTDGYKIEKLMAFLSIGFVWAILAGDHREKTEKISYKKKNHIE